MCERKKEILPSLPFPVDKGREWMRGVEREGGGCDDSRGKDLNMNTASVAKTPHRELKKDRQQKNISPKNINSPKELLLSRGRNLGCN